MSNTINTSVSVGKLNFAFTDEDGNAFSSFRMNPADFSIAARCSEVSEYFSKHEDISGESIEGMLLFNKELEEKICYILGYDARDSIFGEVSAATVLPNGDLFAMVVLDTIAKAVKSESEKRAKKSDDAVKKYTAKYDGV